MVNSKENSWFSIFTIYILWISAAFDPVGKFWGLRYIALGLVIADLAIGLIKSEKSYKAGFPYFWNFCYFVLLLPCFGLIVGLVRGGVVGGSFTDTSYLASAVYFGCSLVYLRGGLLSVGLKAQVFALRALSLVIVFCLIVFVFELPEGWIWSFVENGVAYIGRRNYAGINFYYIYFIASPMIIFLLAYEAWRYFDRPSFSGIFLMMLPVTALFLSGTRLNILIAVLGVPLVYFWRRFGVAAILFGTLTLIVFAVLLKISGIEMVESIFDSGEVSNAQKLGYLKVYLDIFSDPVTILLGQGFNAHIWSQPLFDMLTEDTTKTELTYLEIFREFGFIVGFLFFALILQMIRWFNKEEFSYRWIAPAIVMYILVSSLNPYVFSSNGMLVLGFAAVVMGKRNSSQLRVSNRL